MHGVQVGDTVTTAVETMVVVGKLGVTVTISVVVEAMVEYRIVFWTFVMVIKFCSVVVVILVVVVVLTTVSLCVTVEILVLLESLLQLLLTVSVSFAVEVLMTVCVLVIVCLSVTVDMWVVGVALAQKLLRNLSTLSSH